ncbi:uncharacterized protein LACBIDRAFT_301463 [Laccaria bicolor S238N-H82]|uniref:Predicted protein n=1 Tax=Laccaria bicolor (strain S238N-H82 / ATCC MYA-4686) TaxID=486041 RepID=B0CNM0_LACBS|nr:uncharacterized protein LACBIDRAFT_301463 [Laccaria bicolor S238N-H82]EDR15953.1 predicted protein [Laccaria bicolor S238N-H82]|eukprot:XP_001874161.1 predicted protein [Laccaria bicolor S238N-H82]
MGLQVLQRLRILHRLSICPLARPPFSFSQRHSLHSTFLAWPFPFPSDINTRDPSV